MDFWWVLALGALAGALGEIALILGARVVLHRYTLLNPQGIWMAPLANALFLLLPLGAVFIVLRRLSPTRAIAITAGIAATFAALAPLLVLRERVHFGALLLLAVGVGVQIARFAQNRPARFAPLLRGATLTLAAVSLLGTLAFNGTRAWRERSALAALPAADPEAPNIILLVLDTVRALSLSTYGYSRDTSPFLSELAASGVRFDRAISTAPWTLTSHASMFTGRYPHETSAGWSTPLDGTFPTLAERLGLQGYATAGVAANLRYCSYEFGLARGFAHYRDYDVSLRELFRVSSVVRATTMLVTEATGVHFTPGRQWGGRINERLLAWLDRQPAGRPFFAFLNYYDAHAPYAPPAPYDTLYLGRQPSTVDPSDALLSAEAVEDLQAAYDASIRYADDRLRELHAALAARGLWENTVIIVTSDHGEEFNEHGHMDHGNSLYFPSVHVPLVISYPKALPGAVVVPAPVTLRDLAATIQELARTPESLALPGHSLSPYWTSPGDPVPEHSPRIAEVDFARNLPGSYAISKGDMKSLAVDGLRFIRRGDGFEEFFDIRQDPWEAHEISGDSTRQEAMSRLRREVQAIVRDSTEGS